MTLVVAYASAAGVWLSSDMRVTDRSAAGPPSFARAALKLVVVKPALCIGYAGRVGEANVAIEHVHSAGMSTAEAVDYLLAVHCRERAVDFVVASMSPPSLMEIKDGQAAAREMAWLGDADAFVEYQRLFDGEHSFPPEEFDLDADFRADLERAIAMNDAMQDLVLPSSHWAPSTVASGPGEDASTIGEASVTVKPRTGEAVFEYHTYSSFGGALGPQNALLATAAGTFSLAFQVPVDPGVGAVGIYFEEGGFGILYAPLLTDHPEAPESLRGANAEEFRAAVRARHGLALRGSSWRPI